MLVSSYHIYTDQEKCFMKFFAEEASWKNVTHLLCTFHIFRNIQKNIGTALIGFLV